jgi:hypothetical protein
MDIANKDRFPHVHALEVLGGEKSPSGEEYYEIHEKELQKEFCEIMDCVAERFKLGGLNVIHGGK